MLNHSVYTYDSIKEKKSKNNRGIILEKDRYFTVMENVSKKKMLIN